MATSKESNINEWYHTSHLQLAQETNLDANLISNQVVLVLGLRSKTKLDKFSLTKKVIMKFRIEIGDKRFQQWGFVSSPEALS